MATINSKLTVDLNLTLRNVANQSITLAMTMDASTF